MHQRGKKVINSQINGRKSKWLGKKKKTHVSSAVLMKFTSQYTSKGNEITFQATTKWNVSLIAAAHRDFQFVWHFIRRFELVYLLERVKLEKFITKLYILTHRLNAIDGDGFATCSDDRADFCAHLCISISIECCNATFSFVGQRHVCRSISIVNLSFARCVRWHSDSWHYRPP